ncbi:MAG: 3-oxoacyl-ACP reductase FabG [Planctomycetes bacterium]|nr:3-oxoacyl-ACP reductase FabG [Planctomycetota bacterium]
MSPQFDIGGQVAVVTGGTRGIGAAISSALLEEGCIVHAVYQGNAAGAQSLRESCAAHSERLFTHALDVANHTAVESFWSELEPVTPNGVQILVNNAGIRRDAIVGTMKPDDWQRVIDVNLTGSFAMSKFAVLNMMQRRYGRIVMITSPAAHQGFQGQAAYAASKAGQQGLMRSLAREVAKRKITVNCVSPGFIDTELLADLAPEQKAEYLKLVPLNRFGTAQEVAYAVLMLCSPRAAYIHGTTLEVTGGI